MKLIFPDDCPLGIEGEPCNDCSEFDDDPEPRCGLHDEPWRLAEYETESS
jgi:hypothetical protein